jgi:hypothetical protein
VDSASEILALTLIFVVHVAGGLLLVWGMLDSDHGPRWWRRGNGPDDPPPPPPAPRPPAPPSARSPLPLPGAAPSRVRLRDDVLLRDSHPRPPRRPGREPGPERSPARR